MRELHAVDARVPRAVPLTEEHRTFLMGQLGGRHDRRRLWGRSVRFCAMRGTRGMALAVQLLRHGAAVEAEPEKQWHGNVPSPREAWFATTRRGAEWAGLHPPGIARMLRDARRVISDPDKLADICSEAKLGPG